MTIVSKASAFPKSVQAGIPRLGRCPEGWTREPLSCHLVENLRPVKLSNDAEYDLVTVKRSRGGVVRRERLKGRDISVKSQFLLHKGDFLISKRQIVHGACGLVPADLAGSIVSNEYAILGAKPTIDLNFLNHLAHSVYFQQTCFHSSIGVHVEKMIFKLDRWLGWEFDLPPLQEQRRIAEILSTWDRAIEKAEALISNARSQRQAIMGALLTGKKRLPGFSGAWKQLKIREFCDTYSGGTPSRLQSANYDGGIPWIKSGELNQPEVSRTGETISEFALKNSSAKIVLEDTILIAMYGATAGVVSISKIRAAINQAILAVIPQREVSNSYLIHALKAEMDRVHLLTQGGQPNLNAGIIGNLKIAVPPRDEQDAISAFLDGASNALLGSKSQLAALREEKDALMQQLLTGKRRVKVEKREIA